MIVWDDFRVFLALARNPNLRSAAKTVGIDPTTMIRRLAKLAEALDATLFERRGGQHILTERGLQLLANVDRAEAAILEGIAATENGGVSGVIRLAAPEALATYFIGPKLAEFQAANPKVLVDIIAPSWIPDPLKREVDVAILIQRPVRGPLTARSLVKTTLQLYASQEYLDANPPIRGLDDLQGHRFLGYVRTPGAATHALEETNTPLRGLVSRIRTTSLGVQTNLVVEGMGIALLPYYVGARNPNLKVVCGDQVCISQTLWLVVREDVRESPRVAAFVCWLVACVRKNKSFFSPPKVDDTSAP